MNRSSFFFFWVNKVVNVDIRGVMLWFLYVVVFFIMFLVLFGMIGVVLFWVVMGVILCWDCLLEILLKLIDCIFLFFWGRDFLWSDMFIGVGVIIWMVEIWGVDMNGEICFWINEVV